MTDAGIALICLLKSLLVASGFRWASLYHFLTSQFSTTVFNCLPVPWSESCLSPFPALEFTSDWIYQMLKLEGTKEDITYILWFGTKIMLWKNVHPCPHHWTNISNKILSFSSPPQAQNQLCKAMKFEEGPSRLVAYVTWARYTPEHPASFSRTGSEHSSYPARAQTPVWGLWV